MEVLEQYIVNNLTDSKASVDEVSRWIQETYEFFAVCDFDTEEDQQGGKCWAYWALDDKQDKLRGLDSTISLHGSEISQSTNSMIVTALLAAERDGSRRASSGHVPSSQFNRVNWHPKVREGLQNRAAIAIGSLATAWCLESAHASMGTHSDTYGPDDIFTLSWYFDIFSTQSDERSDTIMRSLINKIIERTSYWLTKPDKEKGGFHVIAHQSDFGERIVGESSYIFLRFTRLLRSIYHVDEYIGREYIDEKSKTIIRKALDALGEIFRANLHEQLSYYEIKDAGFDPAELAFCLEGLTHCSSHLVNPGIFDRVFEVILASQAKTSHLRTETPVITRHTGEALFTVSVETMNSLLSSLSIFDTSRPYKMMSNKRGAKYLDIFSRYFEWLKTRKNFCLDRH